MPKNTLSEMITKESQQFADSQKYSAQSFGDKIANMLRYGPFVAMFTAWDDQTEEQLARGYPDRTRRFSDIDWWTSSASVKLYLGAHDEYGEANELLEQFEAMLIQHDMSFIAPKEFKVIEYNKSRELVYKFNQDGKWEDRYTIAIIVCGENSDKCIVITEETGEMTEPKPITRTRLICAGDAEFAEHMKKEEASARIDDNTAVEDSADTTVADVSEDIAAVEDHSERDDLLRDTESYVGDSSEYGRAVNSVDSAPSEHGSATASVDHSERVLGSDERSLSASTKADGKAWDQFGDDIPF